MRHLLLIRSALGLIFMKVQRISECPKGVGRHITSVCKIINGFQLKLHDTIEPVPNRTQKKPLSLTMFRSSFRFDEVGLINFLLRLSSNRVK